MRGNRLVLVGFAEAYAAIEATWSLQSAGFRVAAFTRRGDRPALARARGVEIYPIAPPEEDAGRSLEDVAALADVLAPAAYLPLDDAAVWLAPALERAGVVVAGPTGERGEYALDKRRQLEAAKEAGLPVPPTEVVERPEDVEMGYPLVVKPARPIYRAGSALVRPPGAVCSDTGELRSFAARAWAPPVLVQPLLRGTGEGLFGHAGEDGVVGWSAHRRVRMVNPQGSASSACAAHPVDASLVEPAERFLSRIGWRGLFMLEFLRDSDGRPWLMELNGRAWGSIALARRRGFEYPAWTVRAALDPSYSPAVPSRPPRLVCRHLGMELVHLAFVLRGPQSTALTDWPRLWPTIRQLARVSRGETLYNWNRSQPGVLAADTVQTLRSYGGRAFAKTA